MKRKNRIEVSLAEIERARVEIEQHLPMSPLVYNSWLSERYGCELYLKLENMQPIGSFKARGATYKISTLTQEQKRRGVIAASAGNHAQGVAWASTRYGVDALIVMPKEASLMKVENTRSLGAKVHLEGADLMEAYEVAKKISRKTGRVFVHAYEDAQVISGQGTLGLELLEQLPEADVIIGSIGGGGLMAGVGLAVKALNPKIEVIGCQAKGASAMAQSLKKHRPLATLGVQTFADGIAIKRASPAMLRLLEKAIDRVCVADDEAIAAGVLTLIEKAKTVAEGAGALPIAVLDQLKKRLKKKKVVVIICGGNIDVNILSRILDRGLIRAGRRLRVNVLIDDRPGSLNRLTELLARQGVSILQAIHDRSEPFTTIDQTEVALTLETKGATHSREVVCALRDHVLRLELVH